MQAFIVDDDPEIAEVVSLCFEVIWPGATPLNAYSGQLGIQIVEPERPDVVFLEIGLPDIDGFEVCTRIREFSDVPILMVTVRDRLHDVLRALYAGADDYIAKSFKPIELLVRVNSILR